MSDYSNIYNDPTQECLNRQDDRKNNSCGPEPCHVTTCFRGLRTPRDIMNAVHFENRQKSFAEYVINFGFVIVGTIYILFKICRGASFKDIITNDILGIVSIVGVVNIVVKTLMTYLVTPGIDIRYREKYLDGYKGHEWKDSYSLEDKFTETQKNIAMSLSPEGQQKLQSSITDALPSGFDILDLSG